MLLHILQSQLLATLTKTVSKPQNISSNINPVENLQFIIKKAIYRNGEQYSSKDLLTAIIIIFIAVEMLLKRISEYKANECYRMSSSPY